MIWVLLVAAVLVVLGTSLIKFAGLSEKVKNLIAIGLSVLVGAGWWFVSGGQDVLSNLDTSNVTSLFAIVSSIYGLSQVLYHFLLDGTAVDNRLEAFAAPNGGDNEPGA